MLLRLRKGNTDDGKQYIDGIAVLFVRGVCVLEF